MTKIFEALENASLERSSVAHVRSADETLEKANHERLSVAQVRSADEALERPTKDYRPATVVMAENIITNLYQHVVISFPREGGKIIQFQGTREGEGTTTVVRELAKIAAFKLKKSVLLLDLDRERPAHLSFFNVSSKWTWEVIINTEKRLKEIFHQIKDSSLYVAEIPMNENSESLICELPQIEALFEEMKKEFDLILLDSPPAKTNMECILLSRSVDGVVLVVEAEKTRWQAVDKVKTSIEDRDGKILGVVLNKRRYPIPSFIYNKI